MCLRGGCPSTLNGHKQASATTTLPQTARPERVLPPMRTPAMRLRTADRRLFAGLAIPDSAIQLFAIGPASEIIARITKHVKSFIASEGALVSRGLRFVDVLPGEFSV